MDLVFAAGRGGARVRRHRLCPKSQVTVTVGIMTRIASVETLNGPRAGRSRAARGAVESRARAGSSRRLLGFRVTAAAGPSACGAGPGR